MYNQYFGFRESPFSVTPDPRFFFATPVYLEAYATLRYGIEGRKGFVAMTGEVGTGKTTILRHLLHTVQDNIHSAFIFNTDLTFDGLLKLALVDLGLQAEGRDRLDMLEQLNAYLIEELRNGRIVSLLIDEAQNLSDESLEGLRLLSNFETDREKLLQIVLVGQPELNARLDRLNLRQLKQRIALSCEIAPLRPEEVGSYIKFRLQVAGSGNKELFAPDAVQRIAFYSRGIPRLINVVCDNALLIAYAASQSIVSAEMITEAAHDLRLETKAAVTEAEPPASTPPPVAKLGVTSANSPRQFREASLKRTIAAGIVAFFAGSISVALIWFTLVQRSQGPARHGLNEPAMVAQPVDREAEARKLKTADAELRRRDRRMIIPYGSTIYKMATEFYGTDVVLGMDLIKEFNPQIANLNFVAAGQQLLLPALAPERLARRQRDGSYHVIVASFLNRVTAEESADDMRRQGYQIITTPRRVSNDLVLYRLEMSGLNSLEEAAYILAAAAKRERRAR